MALNRYTKLPTQNLNNNQVLPSMGVLDSVLAKKQQSYDTTATAIAQKQQEANSLQGYGDKANEYLGKVKEDMNSFVGSIANQDLGSPEVRNKFSGYVQAVSSDPQLKAIQQAKLLRDNYEKQQLELDSKGKLHENQRKLQDLAWNNYSKTGKLSPELTQPLYEAQDLIKGRSDLVSMIKANGTDVIQALSDGTAYKNSSKGVASDRIKKAVEAQLPTYANSAYGRQEANDFKVAKLEGSIPKDMSFADYLTKQVLSTASNFAYSDFSTNKDVALRDKQSRDLKKKEEDAYAGEGFAPAMTGSKKVELDSDGRININPALDIWDAISGGDSRTPEQLELEKTIAVGAKKSNMTPQAYAEQLNKDPNVRVMYYNADKADKVSTQFYNPKTGGGTYVNSTIYTNQFPQGISTMDFLKEKGLDEKALSKGFTVTGDITSDNPYTPKGKQAIIGGESVIIDDKYSKPSLQELVQHEANKAKYNGTGVHTTRLKNPADNKTYELTYVYDASTGTVKEDETLRKVIK